MREQIFGTNVLEIAVFIYTNKMSYGIIRVVFVLLSPFWIYCYYGMWKNGISEQNLLKGHFSENGRCASTNSCRSNGIFDLYTGLF